MSLIARIANLVLHPKRPVVLSKVDGFSITLEKKDGVLLTSTPKDDPDAKPKDVSMDSYYELTVTVDGSNVEYPAEDKPSKYRYTILKGDGGFGFTGGVSYIPQGARWIKFELVEEFDGAKEPPMGKWMPPHHHVLLRAHYRDASGQVNSVGLGGWVRKSEREAPEWRAAAMSPVTYC